MTKKLLQLIWMEPCSTRTVKFLTLPKKPLKKLLKKAIRLLLRQVALTVCQKIFTVNWA